MRHACLRNVGQDVDLRRAPTNMARRRPQPSRQRLGRLEAIGGRIASLLNADEECEEEASDIAGPELLDAAFDELGDLAIVRGHLSDRVRLHVSTKHRHDLEDLW